MSVTLWNACVSPTDTLHVRSYQKANIRTTRNAVILIQALFSYLRRNSPPRDLRPKCGTPTHLYKFISSLCASFFLHTKSLCAKKKCHPAAWFKSPWAPARTQIHFSWRTYNYNTAQLFPGRGWSGSHVNTHKPRVCAQGLQLPCTKLLLTTTTITTTATAITIATTCRLCPLTKHHLARYGYYRLPF
jgi:hypothetical protein